MWPTLYSFNRKKFSSLILDRYGTKQIKGDINFMLRKDTLFFLLLSHTWKGKMEEFYSTYLNDFCSFFFRKKGINFLFLVEFTWQGKIKMSSASTLPLSIGLCVWDCKGESMILVVPLSHYQPGERDQQFIFWFRLFVSSKSLENWLTKNVKIKTFSLLLHATIVVCFRMIKDYFSIVLNLK